MATITIKRSDRFPVGSVVGAYPALARHFDGVGPTGAAVESHTVPSSGTLSFTELVEGSKYVLWASVAGESRYVALANVPYVAPGTLKQRILARREAVGAV